MLKFIWQIVTKELTHATIAQQLCPYSKADSLSSESSCICRGNSFNFNALISKKNRNIGFRFSLISKSKIYLSILRTLLN